MPRPSARAKKTNKANKTKSRTKHPALFRPRKLPLRLAYHRHTGQRLPVHCTSYAALFALIVFASALILFVSKSVQADQYTQSGSVTVSGNIVGQPPEQAAQIVSPANNSRFTNSQVTVTGNCLSGTIIEIYNNDIFAGDTLCTSSSTFELTITLVPDHNRLIAKTKDSADQYGPDSAAANVYLDRLPNTAATPSSAQQYENPLFIYTEPGQKRTVKGQKFTLKYSINGSRAPYTISIDWGDGTPASLLTRDKSGDFSITHEFAKSGQIIVRISALGGDGGQGSIQTTVFVVPASSVTGLADPRYTDCNTLASYFCVQPSQPDAFTDSINKLWIAITLTLAMTLSFWLGERVIMDQISHKFRLVKRV